MPSDRPPRSARELVDPWLNHDHEASLKSATSGRQALVTPAPVGGGRGPDLGRGPDKEGLENSDQQQLDREAAALGRQDRPGLPDKPDAGGGAQLDRGTSLSDSNTTPSTTHSTTPSIGSHP